ncbi:FKBP-type peptidyl-prolyl cis-trans isomerase [Bernardetia sp.]|uniref:FKBP-type peptidyl-prolyl cis-trans isomerase n=1 Tax=Bernardetia sp. TaxID=1937974 RepID=UPI0025BFC858|nr:FKBP-type peptidyl-prolyl cis-trans isomerase [Bernardetia sp.]
MKLFSICKTLSLFVFTCISFSVFAQFEEEFKEYKGLRYQFYEGNSRSLITDSSIIQVQMKVFNSVDSLLQQTYQEEIPTLINLRDSNNIKMPLVEIIIKGQIGDSLTVYTQSDSIYQGSIAIARPPFIPKGSWIRQEFRIVRGYNTEEYEEVQQQIQKIQMRRQQEYMEKMQEEQAEIQRQSDSITKLQVEYIENTFFVEKGIKEYKKTESGLFYTVDKQGKQNIEEGDKVRVHYKGTLLKTGEKFDSSYDRGEPIELPIGVGQVIKGWDEGIPLIGRGGKGTLYIPSDLGYGARGSSNVIPPNAILVFSVEVIDDNVKGETEIEQNSSEKESKTYRVNDSQEDYIENVFFIQNRITDYKKTTSGLFYRIEKQGTPIKKGEKLRVHYEGITLMSGEKFDSSFDRDKPIEITIGENHFIDGWDEGIPLIGKGGKGYLYIPSHLGYGERGAGGAIKPNSILVFKVEILEN